MLLPADLEFWLPVTRYDESRGWPLVMTFSLPVADTVKRRTKNEPRLAGA